MLEELKSRPNYKWLILAVSMLTFGSANMGTQVLSPLRGKIAADVAMTETQMGMLTSAYVIAGIFLPILLSMVYRRAPIKKIVIAGGLLMSAGFLAFSFASDYRGLIIARFISGIGSVVFLTASPVIASYAFRDGGLGFAMGIYGIAPCLFSLILGKDPVTSVLSGGLLFGAVFMATDYVTCPMSAVGQIIYAALAGLLVALIRAFSSYPEGVTYAILLMNIAAPVLDHFCRRRVYGHEKGAN